MGGGNSERCLKWGGGGGRSLRILSKNILKANIVCRGGGVTTPVSPNFNHTLGLFALSIALGVFTPLPPPPPPRKFDPDKLEG